MSSSAWADSDSFLEFCGLAGDLAGETEDVDAVAFVELFVEAAQRFGEQPLRYESQFLGFGPQDALIAVIRSDRAGAQRAVERLIEECSVWLSWHVGRTAHAEARGTPSPSAAASGRRLVEDEAVVGRLIQQWQAKAMAELHDVSEPSPGWAAFDLACVMRRMGGDAGALREALTRIVEHRPRGLEICFCDASYSDVHIEHFGLPHRELLPEPNILKAALSRSSGFEEGHERLLNWKTQATSEANPPTSQSQTEATPTTPDAPAPATAA